MIIDNIIDYIIEIWIQIILVVLILLSNSNPDRIWTTMLNSRLDLGGLIQFVSSNCLSLTILLDFASNIFPRNVNNCFATFLRDLIFLRDFNAGMYLGFSELLSHSLFFKLCILSKFYRNLSCNTDDLVRP